MKLYFLLKSFLKSQNEENLGYLGTLRVRKSNLTILRVTHFLNESYINSSLKQKHPHTKCFSRRQLRQKNKIKTLTWLLW